MPFLNYQECHMPKNNRYPLSKLGSLALLAAMSIFIVSCTNTATLGPTKNQPAITPLEYTDNIYKIKTKDQNTNYMTDFAGMTLYVFDGDTPGKSDCYGACAITWKPYSSGATAQKTFPSNITVLTRDDGSEQFMWKGQPLYYYQADASESDVNGDGVGGKWHIVKL
jgi:predicted lipoprotein with Yx(FWY)xxD motif